MEPMECQCHNNCGGWCEAAEDREQCLCCDCLEAEREEDAERQHTFELDKAMQRIACAAGIELAQPSEIADIVCGRLVRFEGALKRIALNISGDFPAQVIAGDTLAGREIGT